MQINETNKALYESAFIENGEYGYHGAKWKPNIDESNCDECMCEDEDGHYIPATPLGYRDYKISRMEGLNNIFEQAEAVDLTNDRFHQLKRHDNAIKQYDKILTDKGEFIVVADDEDHYFVVNQENKLFSVEYVKTDFSRLQNLSKLAASHKESDVIIVNLFETNPDEENLWASHEFEMLDFHPNGICGCIEMDDAEIFGIQCNHLMWSEGWLENGHDSILIYGNDRGHLIGKLVFFNK